MRPNTVETETIETARTPGKVILQAVMGSHAYGLSHPDSDYDRKGVYVTPALEILGLFPPKDTVSLTEPDFEYHELGKFCRLALKCNPTVIEQLFIPEEDYEILTLEGRWLVSARYKFLSRDRIRGAFGGYAMDQKNRLLRRGDGSFSSDTRKRKEKHARHLFRLMHQGISLLETGELTVRVTDPDRLFELGRLSDDEIAVAFDQEDERLQQAYERSSLPEHPSLGAINRLMTKIREANQ